MTSSWVLAFAILSTSFLGSWHCAGMCGPMASLMAQRRSLLSYHWGRLCSYVLLGSLAGASGDFLLNSRFLQLRWAAVIIMATLLFVMGVNKILPEAFPAKWRNLHIAGALIRGNRHWQTFKNRQSGFQLGLLTALLPCGWLYTYVLAAAATRSPFAGGVTLFLFWLGGLPALATIPFMIRQGVRSAGLRQQWVAGLVLIGTSLYSLASFMFLH